MCVAFGEMNEKLSFVCGEKDPILFFKAGRSFFFAAPTNSRISAASRTLPSADGALSGILTKNVRQRTAAPPNYSPDIMSHITNVYY